MSLCYKETVATYTFNGHDVEVVGYYPAVEGEAGTYEYYDLFLVSDGTHLNEGDPWYPGERSATEHAPPSEEDVLYYLTPTWGERLLEARVYRIVSTVEVTDKMKDFEDRPEMSDEDFILGELGFANINMDTCIQRVPEPGDPRGKDPIQILTQAAEEAGIVLTEGRVAALLSKFIKEVDPTGFVSFVEEWAK